MGRDKALMEIGNVPLLLRIARLLQPLVASVAVIGPPERYPDLGLPIFPDDRAGLGPLGGIATALRLSASDWTLVVGCDMPYLNAAWLGYLISRGVASAADAVLPATPRGPEPLCAVYRRSCAPVIAVALASGVRKITQGLAGLAVEEVAEPEWEAFDSDGRLFKNVNTPADYDEARASLEGEAAR